MNECNGVATGLNVRAIYRSSHYNTRFGLNCADDRVQVMLNSTEWEWWDNRRLSADVWRTQNWNSVHFE
jgi:hypothetical protein